MLCLLIVIEICLFSLWGGHALYIAKRDAAVAQYKSQINMGPMCDHELENFLYEMNGEERGLAIADKESSFVSLCVY